MKRAVKLVAVVAVLGIVAAACGGSDGGGSGDTGSSGSPSADLSGGTLKMAMLTDVTAAFDPQKEYYGVAWEYLRIMLRNLMSYKGVPTDQGGAQVFPDLAAGQPTVSSDGLTWTYKIKPGIKYAPPLQDVTVTAGDFIRALERTADPKTNTGGYSFYYSPIEGFDKYAAGKADSISGLTAVDDTTLQIKVTAPTGDLSYRLAMPAAAPIPPMNDARYGVAEGHDKDYGRFLVSSGPYMFQGAENMDFSVPPKDQSPAEGYVPGRSIVLVRNPSWDASTDELRPAYPDEITVQIGGDNDDLYNKVSAGELDFVVDGIVPPSKLKEYQTNPDLQDRLNVYPSDAVRYVSFNLATPPFDDIHVRKALNWVWNKEGFRQFRGGPTTGAIAGHIIVDSLENNQLADYDPYGTTNDSGDLEKAKAEMAQSKYDTNGDGVCDAPECKNILTLTDREDPYPKQAALMKEFLQPLGITINLKELGRDTMYTKCNDANSLTALCAGPAWGKDYADASTFGEPLFGSQGLWTSCCNYSLLGATPKQLKGWGYDITSVPSVDDKVKECNALVDTPRVNCWAELDKQLMEDVVPWVPYLFDNSVDIISPNVTNYSFDQFAAVAAFDHMAVTGGSSS